MKKRILMIVLSICAMFSLCACSETDPGRNAEIDKEVLVDNVGLSSVESPRKAAVYKAAFFPLEEEKWEKALLKDEVISREEYEDEEEKYIWINTGDQEKQEYLILYMDRGAVTYGNDLFGENYENGFTSQEYLYECEPQSHYFQMTTHMNGDWDPEDPFFQQAEDLVQDCLKNMGLDNFRVRAASKIPALEGDGSACYMVLEQVVDNIPIAALYIPDFGQPMAIRENAIIGFDHETKQPGGAGEVFTKAYVADGQIIDLIMNVAVTTEKKYANKRILTAEKAFRKVREQYQGGEFDQTPSLELAELQYKLLERDGTLYLYPVWTFAVVEYEAPCVFGIPEMFKDDPQLNGEIWHYYIMDAVTGDFLDGTEVR